MFKKLKDKIAEEVKSSPQRIQQLTQSVTERIQNATSDESFFSIGDDDAQSSSPNPEPGFSNVSLSSYSTPNSGRFRRNSNSSVASDMSFLPRYESATNLYHLQSDLDVSASEVEDNASSSSQLGHLSKEQIYAAFQKSQMRYHKYRGRYTDIANHYKELERENSKMKSVLVETQDKALRRVAELREQCSLEQKAKAHLENALRVELDEKQYVIDTLKTKVNLLQSSIKNGDTGKSELLVNVNDNSFSISDDPSEKPQNDNLDILTKDLKDARVEIENLNAKLQEMKANSIIFNSKEVDFKKKISDLEEINKQKTLETAQILERERENNLIIAQTKMELHTEIQNRDLQIENLKHDVETLKTDLDQYESKPKGSTKLENLQSQNTKLIDKVEELTQKCNNYESELLKVEQLRIEIQNLTKINESFKMKVQKLEAQKVDLETNLQQKQTSENNLEEVQNNLQELENAKLKNEDLQKELNKLKEILVELEKIKEENVKLQEQLKQQEAEFDEKITKYREDTKQHLLTLETKIRDKIKAEYNEKEQVLTADFHEKFHQLSKSDNNVKETQLKLLETEEEARNLKNKLEILEETLQKQYDKYRNLETNHLDLITEGTDTRNRLAEAQKQIGELGEQLSRQQNETGALLHTKENLEQDYGNLQNEYETLRNESTNLQNRNSTLQHENETLRNESSNSTSLQNEYSNLQSDNTDLQMKISTLQNEITDCKNENAALLSEKTSLQNEIENLQSEGINLKIDLHNEKENVQHVNTELHEEKTRLQNEITKVQKSLSDAKQMNSDLQERLSELTSTNENFQKEIEAKQSEISLLHNQITQHENKIHETSNDSQRELTTLREELDRVQAELISTKQLLEDAQKSKANIQKTLDNAKQGFQKKIKEQRAKFHGEIQNLNGEISNFKEKNGIIQTCIDEYKQKLNEYESDSLEKSTRFQSLTNENDVFKQEIVKLKKLMDASKSDNEELTKNISGLENELIQKANEVQHIQNNLNQLEDSHHDLNMQLQKISDENNNLKEQISLLQADNSKNVNELISDNTNLKQQLEHNESEHKRLTAENTNLKEQISKLQETEATYKAQISDLRTIEESYKNLQEEKLQVVSENTENQKRIHNLSSENQKLQNEVSQLQEREKIHNEILSENQQTKEDYTKILEEVSELKRRNNELSLDYKQISQENEGLLQELAEAKLKFETLDAEKLKWESLAQTSESEKNDVLKELEISRSEIEQLKMNESKSQNQQDSEILHNENKSLKTQVTQLQEQCETYEKQKKNLEGQLRELENQYTEISHEKQFLQDEIQELKISPININSHTNNSQKLDNLDMLHAEKILSLEKPSDVKKLQDDHEKEIIELNEKLVQYKSLDLTNRSSIQFYENELQKLKNKNEKLNRKLDETLVTLNHCAQLSHSTETEYLRNVLYNYMLGKEGLVLARVIAAVCKFDENQTEAILQREQQKQTLFGQLGFL